MRIVINTTYGGFGLSHKAAELLEAKGVNVGVDRDHPALLEVFDEIGQEAAGRFCRLGTVEIPDDVEWQIEEYDGLEWVAEKHRTWR